MAYQKAGRILIGEAFKAICLHKKTTKNHFGWLR